MSIKRSLENENGTTTSPIDDPSAPERAAEERAVQLGIVVDREFVTFIDDPTSTEHVWLFVPVRTSRRSIERLADSLEGIPRFYVRVRCLVKYVYSDKFDVAFNLAEHRYYLLPAGTFGTNLELRVDQNPAILEFVRAQRIGSTGPSK
jgi:hypothetical protein